MSNRKTGYSSAIFLGEDNGSLPSVPDPKNDDKKTFKPQTGFFHFSLSAQHVLLCATGSMCMGYTISCFNTLEAPITALFNWCEPKAQESLSSPTEQWYDEDFAFADDEGDVAAAVTNPPSGSHNCPVAGRRFMLLNVLVFLTAFCGSVSAGILSNFGRRFLSMVVHFAFVVGGLVVAFANNVFFVVAGRAIQGWAVGSATVVSPLFISEISQLQMRGKRGVLHQLGISIGILLGVLPGMCFSQDHYDNLSLRDRYLLRCFIGGLPAIFSFGVLCFMVCRCTSDTPHFLVRRRMFNEAHELLQDIYGKEEVSEEMHDIIRASSAMIEAELSDGSYGLNRLFSDRWYRRALFAGIGLCFCQQITGINALVSGSSSVFETAGMAIDQVAYATAGFFVINVAMTLVALALIERIGRKTLLIIGNLGLLCILSLPPLSRFFTVEPDLITLLVALCGYTAFFAVSIGPVTWVCIHEMFPPEVQGIAVGLCSAIHWIMALLVVTISSSVQSYRWKFPFFAVSACFSLFFCIYYVLETTGRSNGCSPYFDGRPPDAQGHDHLLEDYYSSLARARLDERSCVWTSGGILDSDRLK